MSSFRLTVPGNLLLAGEYAVLEEGGLGAAVAVEPRLIVTVFPSDHWEIVGRWVGGEEVWNPESALPPTFAGAVFLRALELLESRGGERERRWPRRIPAARIELDSSRFFDAQGRKRGFGSSAALAAGLTAALAGLGERELSPVLYQTAVAAHRHAQGGAGSGYDVTASWFGGFGLFVGGEAPRWEPVDPIFPPLAVFSGPETVRTVGSIARYRQWKLDAPREVRDFLDASNAAVNGLVRSRTLVSLLDAWAQTREFGLQVGRRIGSDASLEVPEGLPPDTFIKALGAGNETGLAVLPNAGEVGTLPKAVVALEMAKEGVRWE